MVTTTQSYFWPVFWACASGVVLLLGLVMELLAEKDRYKTISSFRFWKQTRRWGEWLVIVGVFGEIIVAGIAATREWKNDPRNQPLATASAVARLITSENPKSPLASLLRSDSPAGWQSSIRFLSASNGVLALDGGIGEVSVWEAGSETNREWRLGFHENRFNFLSSEENRGKILVEQFDKVDSLIMTMPFPTNCVVESGSVVLTVNDLKWTFEVPKQKPKWEVISMQRTKDMAGRMTPQIMPVQIRDFVFPERWTNRWYDGK